MNKFNLLFIFLCLATISYAQILKIPDYETLAKDNLENESFGGDLGFSSEEIPSSFSLEQYAIVSDQGKSSSCVGFAVARGAMSIVYNMLNGWGGTSVDRQIVNKFDPFYIYCALKDPNNIECVSSGGCECGGWPDDALEIVKNYGCKKTFIYPTLNCAATLNKTNLRSMVNQTGTYNIDDYVNLVSYYKKSNGDWGVDVDVDIIKKAISMKNPVLIGMRVKSDFSDLHSKNQPYSAIQGQVGGHAVTAIGYDDSKYGGAFRILNSYGHDWGDDGFFWITYEEFEDIVDGAYIMLKDDWDEWITPINTSDFYKGLNSKETMHWEGGLDPNRNFHGPGIIMANSFSAAGGYKNGKPHGWWLWYDDPAKENAWAGWVLYDNGEIIEEEAFGFSSSDMESIDDRKNSLHIETFDLKLSDEAGQEDDFNRKDRKAIKDGKK